MRFSLDGMTAVKIVVGAIICLVMIVMMMEQIDVYIGGL